jgi:hypothetical protein
MRLDIQKGNIDKVLLLLLLLLLLIVSRGSVVGTGYTIERSEFESHRLKNSLFRPDRFWDPFNLVSNGVKWQGREADHSSPTRADVKKTWIYISTRPYAFIAYCLIS